MKKIVIIGGGTGSFTLLKGLKYYDVDLSAIVTTADSGGSSGQLRDEFGVLPPGDLRQCLIALSEKQSDVWRQLFEYRFDGQIEKNNLGNLILTALTKISGDLPKALEIAADMLEVTGHVYPATLDQVHLCAELENGQTIIGESEIDIPKHDPELSIQSVYLSPKAYAYKGAVQAILTADLILIGPGDLYTSIIPNLLVTDMVEALKETKGKVYYVCNVMTKYGETNNYKASNFVREIQRYSHQALDGVICNNKQPQQEIADYYRREKSKYVQPNIRGENVILTDLLDENLKATVKGKIKPLIRHDSQKLAKVIVGLD